ncbi:MAG: hypothetical protein ACE5IB_01585 [Candidatus Geothermarchaeales archaeon]
MSETAVAGVTRAFRLSHLLSEETTRLGIGEALIKPVNLPTWLKISVEMERLQPGERVPPRWSPEPKTRMPALIRQKGIAHLSELGLTRRQVIELAEGEEFGVVTVGRIGGGRSRYLFSKDMIRNPCHEALVAEVCRFLDDRGIASEAVETRGPDVTALIQPFRVAVKAETGTHSASKVQEKIDHLKEEYDYVFVLVEALCQLVE